MSLVKSALDNPIESDLYFRLGPFKNVMSDEHRNRGG